MVPDFLMQLDALPLTTNGKIDRNALPSANIMNRSNSVEYVAPKTELELEIASVWSGVLEVPEDKIGINDDFFLLGGHSLKITKLVSEYYKRFSVKVNLRDAFLQTKLTAHVGLIQNAGQAVFNSIPVLEEREFYPISDAQRRLWVSSQFDSGSIAYNMPMNLKVQIENKALFESAIFYVITRHESLRTVFKSDESGEVYQSIVAPERFNFSLGFIDVRKENDPDEAAKNYIQNDAFELFDLENGPLLRASLIQLGEEEYIFYYNMHHIISDGWSMDVLAQDVITCYSAQLRGEKPELPVLQIQYKDYASWQLSQLNDSGFEDHKEFWMNELGGERTYLQLPTTKLRPKIRRSEERRVGKECRSRCQPYH